MTTRPLQYRYCRGRVVIESRWLNKSLLSPRRRKRRGRGPAQPATACGCYDIGGGIGARPSALPGQQPLGSIDEPLITGQPHQRPCGHFRLRGHAPGLQGFHTSPGQPPISGLADTFAGIRTSAALRTHPWGYAPAFGHEPLGSTTSHQPRTATILRPCEHFCS